MPGALPGEAAALPPDERASPRTGRARAEELIERAQIDPDQVLLAAVALASEARSSGEPIVASLAEQAAGIAAGELGDLSSAVAHLRESVRWGRAADDAERAGVALSSLSVHLARSGDLGGALEVALEARADLAGRDLGRLLLHIGLIHHRTGNVDAAEQHYDDAIEVLVTAHDDDGAARALNNRGLLAADRRRPADALTDLLRAEVLYQDGTQSVAAAKVRHNRGLLLIGTGEVPLGLRLLAEADAVLADHGVDRTMGLLDRCRLLRDLGATAEAFALGADLLGQHRQGDDALARADLAAVVAELALELDRPDDATAAGAHARAAFAEQGRLGAVADADALLGLADAERGVGPGEARATALERIRGGSADPSTLVAVATHLHRRGDDRTAEAIAALTIDRLAEAPSTAATTLLGAVADVIERVTSGQGQGARAALARGFAALDDNTAALGSIELRARAARHGVVLGDLGCQLELDGGDPTGALSWLELSRAGVASLRPPATGADPGLAGLLAELRLVHLALRAGPDPIEYLDLRQRQGDLERAVRDRSWASGPGGPRRDRHRFDLDEVHARLGRRALVAFATHRGQVVALVVPPGGSIRTVAAGTVGELDHHVATLHRALRAVATGRQGPDRLARPLAGLSAAGLAAVAEALGDAPVVIVPTAGLEPLPWALIDGFNGRATSLAPSASTWRAWPTGPIGRVVVAVGPEVEHGRREAAAVNDAHAPLASTLDEPAAVDDVLAAMGVADVVHLVAHGLLRGDNPLLSSVLLADGPLSLYDLERRDVLPRAIVASACELLLGGVGTVGGSTVVGAASALAGRGCERLVASVNLVRDDEAPELMGRFHRSLRSGTDLDEALALAQQAMLTAGAVTTAGFVPVAVP